MSEMFKMSMLNGIRLRWLVKILQDKGVITEAEFEEIWNSWDNEGEEQKKE